MKVISQVFAAVISMSACERRAVIAEPAPGGSPVRANDSSVVNVKRPPPSPPTDYVAVSDIPACLTLVGKDTREEGNLLLARIEMKTTRITSECGCTWKWLLYRSVAGPEGLETELASGTLLTSDPDAPSVERLVVLLSERAHPPKGPLVLHVGCAPAP